LFDQGLGDIFIIRTAGNVVDSIATGSVEYGVEHLKSPLLIVMGHTTCGAVKATVDGGEFPGSIPALAAKIQPSVEKAKSAGAAGDTLYQKSENENVLAVMADLEKSPVVKELVEKGELTIVGAKYHLDTGAVEWFDIKK
jgi:carbonic anhydrase